MTMATTAAGGTVRASLRNFTTRAVTGVDLPSDWTVDFATREIARDIQLPETDVDNHLQHYELFLRRRDGTAELLRPSSTIGDAVQEGDELEPMPEIQPGR